MESNVHSANHSSFHPVLSMIHPAMADKTSPSPDASIGGSMLSGIQLVFRLDQDFSPIT